MLCKNCKSENFIILNQTIQTRKTKCGIISFFTIISSIGIILALILIYAPFVNSATNSAFENFFTELQKLLGIAVAADLLKYCLIVFILSRLFYAILPYETKNIIIGQCKDCGSTWKISDENFK